MVDCKTLDEQFRNVGVQFFTGVPDSCFKPWVNYLLENRPADHLTATVEGEALAIAAGYSLATGKTAGVYLQNSGLGNLINPLTSIVDPLVYGMPALLMISWRAKPGCPDEPQHTRMGENLPNILTTLGVPFAIFSDETLEDALTKGFEMACASGQSFALLMRNGDIDDYPDPPNSEKMEEVGELTRWDAIVAITEFFGKNAVYFSTTGKTSRELYLLRDETGGDHSLDFLNVGGMGYVSSLALGFSIRSRKRAVILDGDGSVLMHMGTLATIGHYAPPRILHFTLDNNAHDSVGGSKTVSDTVNFELLGRAVGYKRTASVDSRRSLEKELRKLKDHEGPALIRVKVKKGSKENLPRPSLSPPERKKLFLNALARS
jgi:phosphonopyruvate decarboxylase